MNNMKLPFEARFLDEIISYQDYIERKSEAAISKERHIGKTGKLFSGNRNFGEVVYQDDGSMKILSIHPPSGSKEEIIESFGEINYKLRIVVDRGFLEVSEFSKLSKDYQLDLSRPALENFDLYISDQLLAKCEIVDDYRSGKRKIGVQIVEMLETLKETVLKKGKQALDPFFAKPMIGYEVVFGEMELPLNEILNFGKGTVLAMNKPQVLRCHVTFDNGDVFSGNLDGEGDCFKLKIKDNVSSKFEDFGKDDSDFISLKGDKVEEDDPFRELPSRKQKEEHWITSELENPDQVVAEVITFAKEYPEEVSNLINFALEMSPSAISQLGQFFNSTRYVGIILLILGDEVSAPLLKNFSTKRIQSIASELKQIGLVQTKERNIALNFLNHLRAGKFLVGGISRVNRLLTNALGEEVASEISELVSPTKSPEPFDFLGKMDLKSVANFLKKEHPQIVAMILAYLNDPSKAAVILSSLSEVMQADVAKRIVSMNSVAPDVVREVERVMERHLYRLCQEENAPIEGMELLTEILNHVEENRRKSLLTQIGIT
jgi:flagellar motor switch protein FliG/flagellar motor switch/type III secretory pathway protein FliN